MPPLTAPDLPELLDVVDEEIPPPAAALPPLTPMTDPRVVGRSRSGFRMSVGATEVGGGGTGYPLRPARAAPSIGGAPNIRAGWWGSIGLVSLTGGGPPPPPMMAGGGGGGSGEKGGGGTFLAPMFIAAPVARTAAAGDEGVADDDDDVTEVKGG